jgi:hypothetical protein
MQTIRTICRFLARGALLSLALPGLVRAAEPHQYRVSIDAAMQRMWVEARFGSSVDTVTARSRDAGAYLVDVRDCDDASPIRLRNQRMMLPAGGIRCMNYTVDLAAAAESGVHNRTLSAENRVVSPALWLWRPALKGDAELHVHFDVPAELRVSVPWPRLEGRANSYRVGSSPESSDAPAVFGDFDYSEVAVPGAVLRVSVLRTGGQNGYAMDVSGINDWLRAAATDVSLAYGRFPNPSPQVVVIPADDRRASTGAVPFGRVIRDGGEAIELFVNRDRPMHEFRDDWTATHEFSHLMLPYIAPAHRWVSEGFAQYYQNVLLARSGIYEPLDAWRKLYAGLERGRQSRPELSPNEATARGMRNGRMKIYWSGAAIALMADVALRERSRGATTLDEVMGRLQDCCLPSARTWTGPELFETLDMLAAGAPVFMPLYKRYADTAGFPDTRPLFNRLGLVETGDGLKVRRGSELKDIRMAITEASDGREQLARRDQPGGGRAGGAGSRQLKKLIFNNNLLQNSLF